MPGDKAMLAACFLVVASLGEQRTTVATEQRRSASSGAPMAAALAAAREDLIATDYAQ